MQGIIEERQDEVKLQPSGMPKAAVRKMEATSPRPELVQVRSIKRSRTCTRSCSAGWPDHASGPMFEEIK